MAKRISELYEHELIELAAKDISKDQIKREWFSRWGLEFPMIRTAFGVKKYGEEVTANTEIKNKEFVAI